MELVFKNQKEINMLLSETTEEILEALWIARENKKTDIFKLSDLREMPDIHTLKELTDAKIIEINNNQIKLLEKGVYYARDAVRRHRLAERLLTDVLAIKKEMIHETACQFEHHLHKGIDTNVCTLLGHPKVCPHGKPIPPGKCCEEKAKMALQAVFALADLKPGQSGNIVYLYTTDPKQAQMLISMGVVPGTSITLLAGFPSFLFQLNEGQFAVDSEVAKEIYVRV